MKPKDLMIGDWVQVNEYDECTTAPYNKPYPTQILHGADIDRADEVTFDPIPITPEILEKNGWRMTECEGEYTHDDVNMFLLTEQNYVRCIIADYSMFGKSKAPGVSYAELCKLHYVHELQQALKLLKLNDLADDFKI